MVSPQMYIRSAGKEEASGRSLKGSLLRCPGNKGSHEEACIRSLFSSIYSSALVAMATVTPDVASAQLGGGYVFCVHPVDDEISIW